MIGYNNIVAHSKTAFNFWGKIYRIPSEADILEMRDDELFNNLLLVLNQVIGDKALGESAKYEIVALDSLRRLWLSRKWRLGLYNQEEKKGEDNYLHKIPSPGPSLTPAPIATIAHIKVKILNEINKRADFMSTLDVAEVHKLESLVDIYKSLSDID